MPVTGASFPMKAKAKLDPKLRRLVYATNATEVLPGDMAGAFLAAADDFDPAVPDAEKLSKRVLVKLIGTDTPDSFASLSWSHIVDEIYTVSVPLTQLDDLAASSAVELVSAGNFLGTTLNTSLVEVRANEVQSGSGVTARDGTGVVVGIIDLGFDFTLDDFRDASGGSRVAFFWNQGLIPGAGESSPADFSYGVEYTGQDIDGAIAAANPFAVVRHNEPNPNNPGVENLGPEAHGTHVAGIAVGNGRSGDASFPAGSFVGAAPRATIIFVQPDTSDSDGSFTDSVHVADAIRYIFQQAGDLGLPCVINMSLGQNGGSHDGESVVERAMDRLLEAEPGRAMVVAAGNEHVWRGHASGHLDSGDSRTLHWRVGGLPLNQLFRAGRRLVSCRFATSSPWQKGLFVTRGLCVRIDVLPGLPATNPADSETSGPRNALDASSTRSGGRSARRQQPPRGPGGSAASRCPSAAA